MFSGCLVDFCEERCKGVQSAGLQGGCSQRGFRVALEPNCWLSLCWGLATISASLRLEAMAVKVEADLNSAITNDSVLRELV